MLTELAQERRSTESEFMQILDAILYPRPVGSEGNVRARNYIREALTHAGWTVSLDQFDQDTIVGPRSFANIIAKWNPQSPRQLVIGN